MHSYNTLLICVCGGCVCTQVVPWSCRDEKPRIDEGVVGSMPTLGEVSPQLGLSIDIELSHFGEKILSSCK